VLALSVGSAAAAWHSRGTGPTQLAGPGLVHALRPATPSDAGGTTVDGPAAGAVIDRFGRIYTAQTAGRPWSMALSPRLDRFEIRTGDSWAHDLTAHRAVVKNRDELSGTPLPKATAWLSWSFRVARHSVLAPTGTVVGQLHPQQVGDRPAQAGSGPILEFRLRRDGQYRILSRTASGRGRRATVTTLQYDRHLSIGPWHHVVVSIHLAANRDGRLEIWLDGRRVVDRPSIAIGYPGGSLPYWKYGVYRHAARGRTVVDWADVEVGGAALRRRIRHPLPVGREPTSQR
jgi:hypothetical protein